MKQLVLSIFSSIFIFVLGQTPHSMVFIKGGTYVPLYSLDSGKVEVKSFYIDKYPVTNAEYEKFVKQHPQWQRNKIKPIFADKNYLKNWATDSTFGKSNSTERNSPVVYVSWFAAKKYCECQGKRLPTVKEWEFVALASETQKDATNDKKFNQRILDWYGKSTPKQFQAVGKTFKNIYGVYDIHGLVWEWNQDFISALSVKDSRDGNNVDKNEFCGAASNGSKNPGNYAAFMRYAMRSSLKANYAQPNLGFRCVANIKANK